MKITISKTINEEHELELPAFKKNSAYLFKIISETQTIQICTVPNSESIALGHTSVALTNGHESSNQVEFDFKFNELMALLMEKSSI
jgi:hypothetical protein